VTAAGLAFGSAPAQAGIWTPVASGTNEDILALEYQAEDRLWFTTAGGKIFRREGGSFRQVFDAPVTLFDIAFQPGRGDVGLAVGQGGKVYRSADAGGSWTEITGIPVSNPRCDATVALSDVTTVRWASPTRAFVFGSGDSQLARSDEAGAQGSWRDANRLPENGCRIADDEAISDAFFPEPGVGFFMLQYFGDTYFSTDDLQSRPAKLGDGPNGFENVHRLAGDPLNQNRQWALTPEDGNGSYFQRTESGWRSSTGWEQEEGTRTAGYDIAYAGGTVLAVGDSGMILNSTDGVTFHPVPADGELTTKDWRSVAMASGTQGAVGGRGGALVLTGAANSVPPPPPPPPSRDFTRPTGTISGPAEVAAGAPSTYAVSAADNPGGRGIDPASFLWSATGQPAVAGPSATFTFAEPGVQTISVRFRDGAGNTGTASQTVTVIKAVAVLPATSKPPATIRRSGGKLRITVKGRLRLPTGITRQVGCRGNVIATVKKGKRLISARVIKLSRGCSFKRTITLRRSKVGRAKRLGITLRLEGNDIVGTTRKSYKLRVPR